MSHQWWLFVSLLEILTKMIHGDRTEPSLRFQLQECREQGTGMSGWIMMQRPVHDQAPLLKCRLLMHRKVWACKMWNKISAQDQNIPGSGELRSSEQTVTLWAAIMMPDGWGPVTRGQCSLQIQCSECSHNNKIRTQAHTTASRHSYSEFCYWSFSFEKLYSYR